MVILSYIPLTKEDYNVLENGGKIKCPYKKCRGLVSKVVDLSQDKIYTEFELDESVSYVCNKKPLSHMWGTRKL